MRPHREAFLAGFDCALNKIANECLKARARQLHIQMLGSVVWYGIVLHFYLIYGMIIKYIKI